MTAATHPDGGEGRARFIPRSALLLRPDVWPDALTRPAGVEVFLPGGQFADDFDRAEKAAQAAVDATAALLSRQTAGLSYLRGEITRDRMVQITQGVADAADDH